VTDIPAARKDAEISDNCMAIYLRKHDEGLTLRKIG